MVFLSRRNLFSFLSFLFFYILCRSSLENESMLKHVCWEDDGKHEERAQGVKDINKKRKEEKGV